MDTDIIFSLGILIMSVVVHEVSHGYAAFALGDRTAYDAKRLTLNPLRHLDLVGSFVVPFLTYQLGVMFGWAKPVPYNPFNLRDRKWGDAKVAFAGPLSNFVIAIVFGLLLRMFPSFWNQLGVSTVLYLIVLINVFLGSFNLFPIPPLDGSKVLFSLLPYRYRYIQTWMEQWSLLLILFFVFFVFDFFRGSIQGIAEFIIGG